MMIITQSSIMSFCQETNSFYIKRTVDPTNESELGASEYDSKFINHNQIQEQTLMKKDYQIPAGEKWQIALTNIKCIHTSKCFSFPRASKAKTAELKNVYDLYSIEYTLGPLKYFPVFHHKVTPWRDASDWWGLLDRLAISGVRSPFNWSNYLVPRCLLDMLITLYTNHYDKTAMNKVPITSCASANAAPLLRTKLLDVIPRFGHKPSSSGWHHLTAKEFVHVLKLGKQLLTQYPNSTFYANILI